MAKQNRKTNGNVLRERVYGCVMETMLGVLATQKELSESVREQAAIIAAEAAVNALSAKPLRVIHKRHGRKCQT